MKVCQPNAEPIPGYRLVRYLGRGGFGEVWEAEAPGGLAKAVKMAPMDNSEDALNCREVEGLRKIRSIRHPYLLSTERFEIIDDGYLIIVMELADKSLADRLDECHRENMPGIPRDELMRYMRETAEVLDLMNDHHGLQHMDVKPENLFLSSNHIKVADFGLVQPRQSSVSASALALSPPYAAPEAFDGIIDPTADQYSLAVTYQELLTGMRPYSATDVRALILQLLREKPDLSALPRGDRAVLAKALSRDPADRYTSCMEFVDALSDVSASELKTASPAQMTALRRQRIKTVPRPLNDAEEPAKPLFVRPMALRDRKKIDTVTIEPTRRPFDQDAEDDDDRFAQEPNEVRATFVAYLPLELFAYKLRGFIDALDADVMSCTDDKSVLRFSARRWFGFRSAKGLFMEINTCARLPNSGYRVVDVVIWSSNKNLEHYDLGRRGFLLLYCLKSHLMAHDRSGVRIFKSDEQLRAEIVE